MAPSLVPFCSAFILDETSDMRLSNVDMFSPFEVTRFRLKAVLDNLRFDPANFLGVREENFRK